MDTPAYTWIKPVNAERPVNKVKPDKRGHVLAPGNGRKNRQKPTTEQPNPAGYWLRISINF
jgi:hypothetical protein